MSLSIPTLAEDALEGRPIDDVALDRILEVLAPVELDRSGDVPLLVQVGVLVDLGDDQAVVPEMLSGPLVVTRTGLAYPFFRHAAPPT